jgi:Fe-S-cluster containining protein
MGRPLAFSVQWPVFNDRGFSFQRLEIGTVNGIYLQMVCDASSRKTHLKTEHRALSTGPDAPQLIKAILDMNPTIDRTQCLRCGTCCRKGGPTLHLEDQELVESGIIPLKHLFTIRQGEPAYDNVTGVIAPAVTDIIKIKGVSESSSICRYYNSTTKGCGIYDQRPAECRALKCWDTHEIERLYNCRRLTRRHLLSTVNGLWDLVQDHQERCDYSHAAELAAQLKQVQPPAKSHEQLLQLIHYDESIRQVIRERANLDPGMLPFLFGRELSFTIQMFQLKRVRTDQGMLLRPIGTTHQQVCYRRQ